MFVIVVFAYSRLNKLTITILEFTIYKAHQKDFDKVSVGASVTKITTG